MEPHFETEKELEISLAEAIRGFPKSAAFGTIILHGFGLDLAIFTENSGFTRTCFLEVKAFAEHHGRCGFGNQRGEGNQIRLLFDQMQGVPRLGSEMQSLDKSVRWILANRSRSVGSERYLMFTCAQAQNAAAGGVRPGKQNNLRLTYFNNQWIAWSELMRQLEAFIWPNVS